MTAKGERRAGVALTGLQTLWFNTGTLCNLTCRNCYIESSPKNDRLVYLSAAEVTTYLDEIARDNLPTEEIGFTGGEPFMNRELPQMLERAAKQLSIEVQRRSMALATILEPLLIVVMGAAVMVIVLAVLQPIIQLNTWVK